MRKLRVLLFETPRDPYYNLAFEEALYLAYDKTPGEDPVMRIWRNANAVVIGYFQVAEEEVHLNVAQEIGAKVVRRFTGGGAVYHDLGNINYVVITKNTGIKSTEEIYQYLLEGAINALKLLGVESRLENINDVVANNRKVSGTAATFTPRTLFLHGSLLVSTDLSKLSRVLRISKKKLMDKKVSSVKYRVALLEQVLGRRIGYWEVINAFVEGYSRLLDAKPYYDMPSRLELEIADKLYEEKYTRREWNLERKPASYFRELYREIDEIIESYVESR